MLIGSPQATAIPDRASDVLAPSVRPFLPVSRPSWPCASLCLSLSLFLLFSPFSSSSSSIPTSLPSPHSLPLFLLSPLPIPKQVSASLFQLFTLLSVLSFHPSSSLVDPSLSRRPATNTNQPTQAILSFAYHDHHQLPKSEKPHLSAIPILLQQTVAGTLCEWWCFGSCREALVTNAPHRSRTTSILALYLSDLPILPSLLYKRNQKIHRYQQQRQNNNN